MYSLRRESDGAGDSGGMSLLIWVEDGVLRSKSNARPEIGYAMRVGSNYARTMQAQDWWQTTPVTEILDDKGNMVRFKTRSGSIYTWMDGRAE